MLGGLLGLSVHACAAAVGLSALLAASPAAFTLVRGLGVCYLLSNLLNPKVVLLFVTWLPQFLPTQGDTLGRALLLSAIIAVLYALWFSLYNLIIDRVGALLRTPRVRARIERFTGVLLVGFALLLAVQ